MAPLAQRAGTLKPSEPSGPATVALAVREPATQLNVRWSDGLVRRWPVTLGADAPRMQVLTAERNGGQAP